VPRLSFAQPCLGMVITMWPEERVRRILNTTAQVLLKKILTPCR